MSDNLSQKGKREAGACSDQTISGAIAQIRDRGATVRDRQVDRALTELGDELTAEERAVIETLGDRLVERLLTVPEEQLKAAARDGENERFEAALALFG